MTISHQPPCSRGARYCRYILALNSGGFASTLPLHYHSRLSNLHVNMQSKLHGPSLRIHSAT